MDHADIVSLMEATDAFNNLAKRVVMNHRGTLTKTQMDVLISLKFTGKLSMTAVSDRLAISREQVSRTTGPLVEMGYLNRVRNDANHRVFEVSLTEKGRRLLDEDFASILDEMDENLSPLSEYDQHRLVKAARTVVEVLGRLR